LRLILLLILFPFFCHSQQTIDADAFFNLGLAKFEKVEKSERGEMNFPWIEQYEIRTETRDFDLDRQEYTFRISPSTNRKRKAQKALYELMRDAPDFQAQEIYCDLLLTLHFDWLSLYVLNENKSILDTLTVVLNDKQTVYSKMAGTYDFDPQKLIKLQTELSDLEIAKDEINLEEKFLSAKYEIENKAFDFSDFITIDTALDYIVFEPDSLTSIIDPELSYEKQMLTKELALESAEQKQLFDFAQFRYVGPHSDLFKERFSIGLGFQIPNSGNRKLKIQELQIEQDELDREAEMEMRIKHEKLLDMENDFARDFEAYKRFQNTIKAEKENLQNLGEEISQKEGISPVFLLDIEERNLVMQLKSLSKKERLLSDYLEYMHETGKLCQQSFTNYLKQ
jgi:hypothetical protein